jgi:peptide/nickel transport system permease protein
MTEIPLIGARIAREARKRRPRVHVAWLWFAVLGALVLLALTGDLLAPYDPSLQAPMDRLLPPLAHTDTGIHLLGTDELGRDVLSRIIHATRLTAYIAFTSSVIGLVIGAVVGMCAGYFGGRVDRIGMRLTEAQTAMPMFLFVILLMTVTGPSVTNLLLLLPTFVWPSVARLVRAETLRIRSAPFVSSAVTLGARKSQILRDHILPNLGPQLSALFVIEIGQIVLAEAGLSFLGAGVQEPDLTWGLLIASGRDYVAVAWWLTITPGIFLAIAVFSVNMVARYFEARSNR